MEYFQKNCRNFSWLHETPKHDETWWNYITLTSSGDFFSQVLWAFVEPPLASFKRRTSLWEYLKEFKIWSYRSFRSFAVRMLVASHPWQRNHHFTCIAQDLINAKRFKLQRDWREMSGTFRLVPLTCQAAWMFTDLVPEVSTFWKHPDMCTLGTVRNSRTPRLKATKMQQFNQFALVVAMLFGGQLRSSGNGTCWALPRHPGAESHHGPMEGHPPISQASVLSISCCRGIAKAWELLPRTLHCT